MDKKAKDKKAKKCLVLGCKNHSDAGTFVGDLCSPCYDMLRLGKVHPTNITFIGDMYRAAVQGCFNSKIYTVGS